MACSKTLAGLPVSCDGSMGGVSKVWIAPKDDTATVTSASGKITAISNKADYKGYFFKKNTASMTSTATIDATNGTNFFTTELALVFNRLDADKRLEIQALVLSDVTVVVKDANGNFWYLGLDEPVNVSAAVAQTGTAKADGNNYQITLTDESMELPYALDAELAKDFEAI